MASPEAMAASMVKNVPEKTGKTLTEWHNILQKTSLQKHGELLNVLKTEHGVTHGFANLIVTKFRESGSESAGDLVATQYAGACPVLRCAYRLLPCFWFQCPGR